MHVIYNIKILLVSLVNKLHKYKKEIIYHTYVGHVLITVLSQAI